MIIMCTNDIMVICLLFKAVLNYDFFQNISFKKKIYYDESKIHYLLFYFFIDQLLIVYTSEKKKLEQVKYLIVCYNFTLRIIYIKKKSCHIQLNLHLIKKSNIVNHCNENLCRYCVNLIFFFLFMQSVFLQRYSLYNSIEMFNILLIRYNIYYILVSI